VAQEIVVSYRAEVDKLTGELNKIIAQQEEIALLEKKGNLEVQKGVTSEQQAAKKRTELLKLEEAELLKLQKLRKLAFDPKTIQSYDNAISKSQKNISLLGGKTAKALGGVGGVLKTIGGAIAGVLAAAFSTQAILNFSKASVNAFLEAEKNANDLRNAVVDIGGATETAFQSLIKQSEELQKITIFSDDDIQRAQKALSTFGLTTKQIEELIPKLADFATVAGTDIVSAAQQVGAALEGNGREFKKYQIEVDASSSRQENLNKILTGFTKFAGSAERATESFSGKLQRQRNQVDDLQEKIGEKLLPVLLKLTEFAFRAVKFISNLFGEETQSDADKTIEKLNELNVEFNASIEVLKRGNLQQNERKILIDEINQQYGKYLPNLLTEKSTLQEIEKAQAEVNKQIQGRIILVALEEDIVRITKNAAAAARSLIQVQKDRVKSQNDLSDNSQNAIFVQERLNQAEALARELLRAGSEELTDLKRRYAELAAQLGITENEQSGFNKELDDTREATNDIIQPLRTIKNLYNDLTTLQKIWVAAQIGVAEFQQAVKEAADELEKLIKLPDTLEPRPIVIPVVISSGNLVDSFLKVNQEIIQASERLSFEITDLFRVAAEARIQEIEHETEVEQEALDTRGEAIENQLEKRRISEKEAERQRQELDKQRVESERKAAERIRAIKRRQAILDKTAAIIQITINTAKAVSALLETPILAALAAAEGAAQIAIVAAQPIPYEKGTKKSKGGLALVGEKGPEVLMMNEGSKVLPAKQTRTYGDVLDAMYDNRFEKYILKTYISPALEQQKRKHDQHKQESFASNLGKSIVYNTSEVNNQNGIGSTPTADEIARSVSRRQLQVNAEEIGRAVARNLPTNPYNR